MLGLIVARRALYWLQSGLTAQAKPANRAALSAIEGQVLHGFFDVTLWFLLGGLIVLAVTLLAGPYPGPPQPGPGCAAPPAPPGSWPRRWPAMPAATPRSAGSAATWTYCASAAPSSPPSRCWYSASTG
jgi:hypothetical protein